MVNFTKVVRVTDAVLNCIPGVSAINSAAQALYKVAHRVDTLNPVAPGLKTSIKIHVLSKENSELFLKAIPLLGNLIALIELVLSTLRGFRKDDLRNAIINSKAEVVHLCLGNDPLNNDPARASLMLAHAACDSNDETFGMVLGHREWSARDLMDMDALRYSARNGMANADSILAFRTAHQRVLGADDTYTAADCAKNFLKEGKVDLAGRVLVMLPDATPFYRIEDILLEYSCTKRDQGVAGVLTDAQRNALIAKSTTPSLEQLKNYYYGAFVRLLVDRSAASYYVTHADTLNKLLDRSQLSPDKIGEFIIATIRDGVFTVIEPLVTKYEEQLTPQSKVEILRRLLPFATDSAASHEKRTHLFTSWVDRWKNAISAEARELWRGICYSAETNIGGARIRFEDWGDNELVNRYPTAEQLRAVNDQFSGIFLKVFPGQEVI